MKTLICLALGILLLQEVELGAPPVDTAINVSWAFTSDQIVITLPSSVTCTSTFNKGRAAIAACTTATSFIAAKQTSETSFNAMVAATTTVNSGNGGFQGATGPETYGTDTSDNASILNDSTVGNTLAAAVVAASASVSSFAQLIGVAQAVTAETAATQTMTVRIWNKVLTTWSQTITSANMDAWSTSVTGDLAADTKTDLTITFGSSGTPTGSLTYTSGSNSFVVSASVSGSTKEVKVDWKGLSAINDYYLIPPQFALNTAQNLGWRPNGIYNIGIFRPATLTNTAQGTFTDPDWRKTWMKSYKPFLNDKPIYQAILSGTHDAVATKFANQLLDFYYQTQSGTSFLILPQLNYGVRAFDLRIGETGAGAFVGIHDIQPVVDGSASELTMAEILDDFQTFVTTAGNDGEIIVMDFHRFLHLASGTFNQANCQAILTGHNVVTTDRLIPSSAASLTFSELISASNTQRLICAWNDANKPSQCWTGVTQKWAGAAVMTQTDLFSYFTAQFTAPQSALTSAQAHLSPVDSGPYWLQYELERYFSGETVYPNLNIIHSDFIDSSYMVETTIALNMAKVTGAGSSGAVSLMASLAAVCGLSLLLLA